jgi:Sugar (pentulose and hexulose) kinases
MKRQDTPSLIETEKNRFMDKVMDINGSLTGNILGLDIGTSGIRATVVSPTNVLLHTDQEELPFPTRNNTISEQSPAVWEGSLKRLLKRLRAKFCFTRNKVYRC